MRRVSIKTNAYKNNEFPIAIISTIIGGLALRNEYVLSPAKIYKNTAPSIVTVTSMALEKDPFSPRKLIEVPNGSGAGFFFVRDDYIVTNAHVVKDADTVMVNNETATIVGVDSVHDIALLQLSRNNMKPLKKCAEPAVVGDSVLAIGNPYGFEKSISTGIISGVDRDMSNLVGLIQTDAAINPGNSGGPLIAADIGCVLGINTAIASANGSSSGLGFAIPIDIVDDIVGKIIEQKPHITFQLGVTLLPDNYANILGVHGAIIADVIPDGLGNILGLIGTYRDDFGRPMLGDIIIEINGNPVKHCSDVKKFLVRVGQGDVIKLKVLRSTGIESFQVELL